MFSSSRLIQLIGAIAVIAVLSAFFFGAQTTVTIRDGSAEQVIQTRARTVVAALRAADIEFRAEDLITPPREALIEDGLTVEIERATLVEIVLGDQSHTLYTRRPNVSAILASAGLSLGPSDAVFVDGEPLLAEAIGVELTFVPETLQLERAVPITVFDSGLLLEFDSAARTVGEALWQTGIQIRLADKVSPALDAPLSPGLVIEISRATELLVIADGETYPVFSRHAKVGVLLAELGITLSGEDYSVPGEDQSVPPEGEIQIVRVEEQRNTEYSPIPYETVSQPLADLELDQTTLVQAGAEGELVRTTLVRFENGVEVSREVESEWVETPPEPRIVGYGTNIILRTIDSPIGPIEYWRAMEMYATSYSPSRAGTPVDAPWYGRTRSGKVLTKGMVAIDLNVMQLGTSLYIPGYGLATAEDTGGGVRGLLIDLGYEDHDYVSWHQTVTVYFRTPILPADQIVWILP